MQDLAAVQRRREWPTRIIQWLGAFFLGRMARVLRSGSPVAVPTFLRRVFGLPLAGRLLARLVAFGVWRVRVKD